MTKKNKTVLILSVVFIIVVGTSALSTFYPLVVTATPYYRTCQKVKFGMSKDEAFAVMKPYERYTNGEGFYWDFTGETEYLYMTDNGVKWGSGRTFEKSYCKL
jgi:hypothetical protein